MDKNRTEGTKQQAKGWTKEKSGQVTGDRQRELEGRAEKERGKSRKEAGKSEEHHRTTPRHH